MSNEAMSVQIHDAPERKVTPDAQTAIANERHDDADLPGTLTFWCKMRYWEPREAAALVLGIIPTDLTAEVAGSPAFISLETLIARISSKSKPKPTFMLARLKRLEVDVPEDLVQVCWRYNKAYNSNSMTNSELREALKLEQNKVDAPLEFSNGKEKNSLLAIAYASLRLKFDYPPPYDKGVAAKLENKIRDLGLSMTGKTVDKWIDVISDFGAERCHS